MTTPELVVSDATALVERVRVRSLSARRLIEVTLDRIDQLEPSINAFRKVMEAEALRDADRIDSLSDAEIARLPLAGVPVAIKDDTDVAGQSTIWDTAVDCGVCEHDAVVVARFRRAGATIIGKTNVPELTLWPWTASASWGASRNPWDLERTPGGSSGGSAAAVCSGMAAMALGSDGGGSVRYPAALTGLVGLKPQRGDVPVGPEHGTGWHGLIEVGPLTRSVRDAALFLDVVSNADTAGAPETAHLRHPTTPLRIAVSTNPPPGSQVSLGAAGLRAVKQTSGVLTSLGHHVVEREVNYGIAALWNSTVRLLTGVQDDVATLPGREQLEVRTRAVARLGRLIPARTLRRALENAPQISTSINRIFDEADLVLTPLCAAAAPFINDCPDRGAFRSLRAANTSAWLVPWNLTGQPAVSIPSGVDDDGLPTAAQLVGRSNDTATVLAVAAQIERARPFPRKHRS